MAETEAVAGKTGAATTVAGGILVSRLFGFLREAVLAYFFGAGAHADVFRAALRGPNLLQNLLGEQTLSASFIPVYSRLLEAGENEKAGRFAGAILGLLLAAAGAIALLGILLAAPLVALLAPGYLGDAARVAAGTAEVDRYPLAVSALRLIFPMTGLLVLSSWALGVLNSHRRFFLPYFAPVAWNVSIITALWLSGSYLSGGAPGGNGDGGGAAGMLDRVLIAACVGALVGGGAQFLVQLPLVLRVSRGLRLSLSTRVAGVREAISAFWPLAAGRGVVQLSSYLDLWLSSFLVAGAQAGLGWAQILYLLPVSLFGMSVAAAELPELSRRAAPETASRLVERLERSFRQTAFFTLPTLVGYLVFGFLIVGGIFRRGSFGLADNWLVYLVLCGYSLGLAATNTSRLLNNVFYAIGRTRIPARIAAERVVLSGALGVVLMLWLDRFGVAESLGLGGSGSGLRLGAVGLSVAAGLASWYELRRLRRALAPFVPQLELPVAAALRMLAAALLCCGPAAAVWWLLAELPPLPLVLAVLAVYAAAYLGVTRALGVSEAGRWLGRRRGRG